MTTLAAALLLFAAMLPAEPPPVLRVVAGGIATYAHPGVLEQAAQLRQLPPCPECIGMVAFATAERLGQRVWLQRVGGKLEGLFLVVDCLGHPPPFARWLLDVDGTTARRWGMAAPEFVSVWEER